MAPFLTAVPELERIWLLLEHRRYGLAEDAARHRLAADPADWRACVVLAHALRCAGRLAEARSAAMAAVGLAPESAATHFVLAQVCSQQGLFEQAHKAAIEALRISPHQAEYHGFRAQLFYLSNSCRAAISCANEGLQLDARNADCLLWRAMAQERLEKTDAADEDFDRVLRAAPTSTVVHEWRGKLLLQRHEPHQAALHLMEALRLAPDNGKLLVPLRQARQQQLWPAWLLLLHRKRQHDWTTGLPFSWWGPLVSILTPSVQLRSWWLTRHDPVFQDRIPGQRKAFLRKWLVVLAVLASLCLMAYYCIKSDLLLIGMIWPIATLMIGWMKKPDPE